LNTLAQPAGAALERGLLLAVLYAELFDYALRPEELHLQLVGVAATQAEFDATLERLVSAGQLERHDGFLTWPGQAALVALRRERAGHAARLWPQAERFARAMQRVPFARLVAVCGSLARENAGPGADVDLFVVTTPGRLWFVHVLAMLLRRLLPTGGVELCPNHFLTTDSLAAPRHSLYVAHETVQAVPLFGGDVHRRFLAANAWTRARLPQADGEACRGRLREREAPWFTRAVERLLAGRLGDALDRWLHRALLSYYAWRLAPQGIDRAAVERAYTREHQLVVTGGYAPAVARRFDALVRERLGSANLEDLAALDDSASYEEPEHALYARLLERSYSGGAAATAGPILFGQSYYLRFDPKLWRARQPYPPLGTLLAAAHARAQGHDVRLFDAMLAGSESEWVQALERERPRLALLYEDNFNYLSKMCLLRMRSAAGTMLQAARARGIAALVCGSDASDQPEHYLDAGADYVLVGEGEETLVELLARLTGRTDAPLEGIRGLVYRENGRLVRTPPRPVMRNLDAWPEPAWDLVDLARYRRIWRKRHGRFSINMVTTRGCPYHCNWCAKPIWGQTYNSRSPEHVAAELGHLKQRYAPDHVWFADDIFGLKPGWTARFAELVERQGLRTPFKCLSRADLLLRPGEIAALQRAGCESVWIGAESGSQQVLDAMEKGTTVEQIRAATRGLQQAGLRVGLFLQFGYPGETRDDIERTLELLRELRPDEIGMSVSYPLPGTRFHERVRSQLGEQRNWVDSDDMAMMYRGPFGTAFYRQLYRVVQKEFRQRDAARELRRVMRAPAELRPRHARRLLALGHHALTLPLERMWLERCALAPHAGLPELGAGLSPEQAAQPTPQA